MGPVRTGVEKSSYHHLAQNDIQAPESRSTTSLKPPIFGKRLYGVDEVERLISLELAAR